MATGGSRLAVLALTVIALTPTRARAAPAAELVVYWSADGEASIVARVRDAARAHGAALVDRSPAAEASPEAPGMLAAGVAAYDELRFEDAAAALEQALEAVDRTGGDGLERDALADLFLYRGLTHVQRQEAGAWDELVAAARVDPTRILDPARFPPRAIEQLARARAAVAVARRARVEVAAPAGCAIAIDGADAAGGAAVVAEGDHWVRVVCPGRRTWGRRITVDRDPMPVVATPLLIEPPGDDDALIQARVAGARAVIDVRIADGFARLRHRRVDGRELDQATVAMTGPEPELAVADALARLLAAAPAGGGERWYRSRWTWAAAGAALAAAVLVPLIVIDDDGPAPVVIRPVGFPPL